MPRQLRIEYPGAVYHVMNRGDRREPIFRDEKDYQRFLETLGEACAKADWQVHAYCLMLNHFHLVLETPNANLVSGMKWFLGTYTARFNRRHKLFGHLFSGRYKSLIVDGSGNGYLRTVCDYVHLNPVRAKLLTVEQTLRDFRWSSYVEYLQPPEQRPRWLRVDRLFGEMGIPRDSEAGRNQFEQSMEQRRAQETDQDWKKLRRGWCLGDEDFRRELLEHAQRRAGENHDGDVRRETAAEKGSRIIAEELDDLGWNEDELVRRGDGDEEKLRIARRLRTETSVTWKWIAERIKVGDWRYLANRLNQKRGTDERPNQNELDFV